MESNIEDIEIQKLFEEEPENSKLHELFGETATLKMILLETVKMRRN